MPAVPRSMLRIRPPVLRRVWKRGPRANRCAKQRSAKRVTVRWDTRANARSRNSVNKVPANRVAA